MSAILRLIGLVLIAFAGWNLFMIFETQIISQGVQSQTTGFLDFLDPFIQQATPEPTEQDIASGILYGIVALVGLVLLIRK
jgi:hypothetical protein